MSSNRTVYNLLNNYIPLQSQAIESSIQNIETKTGFIMASIGVFVKYFSLNSLVNILSRVSFSLLPDFYSYFWTFLVLCQPIFAQRTYTLCTYFVNTLF